MKPWIVAAIVSPFLIAAFIARIIWIAILAGWEEGDRFAETQFGVKK